jgi:hypothetical protein
MVDDDDDAGAGALLVVAAAGCKTPSRRSRSVGRRGGVQTIVNAWRAAGGCTGGIYRASSSAVVGPHLDIIYRLYSKYSYTLGIVR